MKTEDLINEIHSYIRKVFNYQMTASKELPSTSNNNELNKTYQLAKIFREYVKRINKYKNLSDEDLGIVKNDLVNLRNITLESSLSPEKKINLMTLNIDRCIATIEQLELEHFIQEGDEIVYVEKGGFYNIVYEAKSNKYYINGTKVKLSPRECLTKKEKLQFLKAKLSEEKLVKIFEGNTQVIKKCDPNLVIILARKSVDLAREYIELLNRGERSKDSKFAITYDLREIKKVPQKKISGFEKLKIKLTARANRHIANVMKDKPKVIRWAALPLIGGLAISWFGGNKELYAVSSHRLPERNSYSHDLDGIQNFQQDVENATKADKKASNKIISEEQENTANEELSYQSISKEVEKRVNEELPQQMNNESNGVINDKTEQLGNDSGKKQPNSQKNQSMGNVDVTIGSKINISNGLKYTADCYGGGSSNKIGNVSWRPATEYCVDGVALMYKGKAVRIIRYMGASINDEISKLAAEYGIDESAISTSVLLSLVPGQADTGWANISMQEMQRKLVDEQKEDLASSYESEVNVDNDLNPDPVR